LEHWLGKSGEGENERAWSGRELGAAVVCVPTIDNAVSGSAKENLQIIFKGLIIIKYKFA